MINITLLLKRKAGTSKEDFRRGYEHHATLAMKHLGHLYVRYLRNYTIAQGAHAGSTSDQADLWAETMVDAITTISFRNREDLAEFQRIASTPEIFAEFIADEELWLDRSNKIVFTTEEVSSPSQVPA
jgi:hypothetical protein